jgi:hypothetical protein
MCRKGTAQPLLKSGSGSEITEPYQVSCCLSQSSSMARAGARHLWSRRHRQHPLPSKYMASTPVCRQPVQGPSTGTMLQPASADCGFTAQHARAVAGVCTGLPAVMHLSQLPGYPALAMSTLGPTSTKLQGSAAAVTYYCCRTYGRICMCHELGGCLVTASDTGYCR